MADWTLQDAKNRFSAVVEAARRGAPQSVTRRGRPAVVVLAAEEYERLRRLDQTQAPSFVDHLLAVPREPSPDENEARADLRPRDVTF